MNDFIKEGVKVGDLLYSTSHGWGNVIDIDRVPTPVIEVKYGSGEKVSYYPSGCIFHLDSPPQSIFWDEPKFEIPAKPKREVVKEFEVYVNYDPKRGSCEAFSIADHADTCKVPCEIGVKGKLTFTILE